MCKQKEFIMETYQNIEPEYLTAKELSKKFSVSLKAIQKWTAQRRLPAVKVGYCWRYPTVEISKKVLSGQLLKGN